MKTLSVVERIVTLKELDELEVPSFQRPLQLNNKMRTYAQDLKSGEKGSLPGLFIFGKLPNDPSIYGVDYQHRRKVLQLSGLSECTATIKLIQFADMAEMAEFYTENQKSFVKMVPNDVLRGIEGVCPALKRIRNECPYVGYDRVRKNLETISMLSMASMLRSWAGSKPETPISNFGNVSTEEYALGLGLDEQETNNLINFLQIAHSSWGLDTENARCWQALNLGLCAWLYRKLLIDQVRFGKKRSSFLTEEQFRKCLMAVAADESYLDMIYGRTMKDRDRKAAYKVLKLIFVKRLREDGMEEPKLPQPPWAA